MAYRFKDPGLDGGRMIGGMDNDKHPRDDMDDLGRSSRPPFPRGRRLSPGRDKPFSDRGRFGRDDGPMIHDRERSPMRGGFEDRYLDRERFRRDDHPFPRREELGGRRDMPRSMMDIRDPFREKFMDRGRMEPPGYGSRYDMPDDPFRPRGQSMQGKGGSNKGDMMRPNECEIIVVNKQQRAYGESIESRLKNLGIQVDILFLKDEALLVQTIDDIARRGCLYAMVVSLLNETHGSVTLNILYGTPQEHRNMPLDDALKLVARNFHDHIRSQRESMDRDRIDRGNQMGAFPADREIQFMLRLLLDGRQLSIGELDTVIRYLNERKEKMKSLQGNQETSAPTPVAAATPSVAAVAVKNEKTEEDRVQKEQDLQNRIMSIMNQATDAGNSGVSSKPGGNIPSIGQLGSVRSSQASNPGGGMNRSGMGPAVSGLSAGQSIDRPGIQSNMPNSNQQPTSSTYINFDNPSVKKALDSLMQSGPNLLKSLSGNNSLGKQEMQEKMPSKLQGDLPNFGGQRSLPGMGDSGSRSNSGLGLQHNRNSGVGDGRSMVLSENRNMGLSDNRNVGLPDSRNMGLPDNRNMGSSDNRNLGSSDNRNMGPSDTRNMGPSDSRNMGPSDSRNMGPPNSRNMGPPDGRNMGMMQGSGGMNPRQGPNSGPMGPGSFHERPGMFPGNSSMMGSRPPYMGGGPMGNQGMGSSGGIGGPRRY